MPRPSKRFLAGLGENQTLDADFSYLNLPNFSYVTDTIDEKFVQDFPDTAEIHPPFCKEMSISDLKSKLTRTFLPKHFPASTSS